MKNLIKIGKVSKATLGTGPARYVEGQVRITFSYTHWSRFNDHIFVKSFKKLTFRTIKRLF